MYGSCVIIKSGTWGFHEMQDSSIKVWMAYSSEACTQSNPEPQTLHMYLSVYTYIYAYIYIYVYTLGK